MYNAYFNAFPGLKDYFRKAIKNALEQGYILIDQVTGRKNWFHFPKNNKEKEAIGRAALNFPIQGEAGSITKLAAILFREEILLKNLQEEIKITNIVHDEINVEAKEEFKDIAANILENAMKKAGKVWCKDIELNAIASISDYWTH